MLGERFIDSSYDDVLLLETGSYWWGAGGRSSVWAPR
jgi:hypothetical protein